MSKKKANKTTITKKCFVVTGEYLTSQARDFWTEGHEIKAIDFLRTVLPGFTEEQAFAVCTGKSKLTGENNNVSLVKDDASSHHGIDISLRSVLNRRVKEQVSLQEHLNDLVYPPVFHASPWGGIFLPVSLSKRLKKGDVDWDSPEFLPYHRDFSPYHPSPEEQFPLPRGDRRSDVEILEDYIVSEEPNVAPAPDPTLSSLNGWIDRQGRFFPCQYMGHVGLSQLLGESEYGFEEKGWIKISDSQDFQSTILERDDIIVGAGFRGPTQAQIDTVFAWCHKHDRKRIPEWLKNAEQIQDS